MSALGWVGGWEEGREGGREGEREIEIRGWILVPVAADPVGAEAGHAVVRGDDGGSRLPIESLPRVGGQI